MLNKKCLNLDVGQKQKETGPSSKEYAEPSSSKIAKAKSKPKNRTESQKKNRIFVHFGAKIGIFSDFDEQLDEQLDAHVFYSRH